MGSQCDATFASVGAHRPPPRHHLGEYVTLLRFGHHCLASMHVLRRLRNSRREEPCGCVPITYLQAI